MDEVAGALHGRGRLVARGGTGAGFVHHRFPDRSPIPPQRPRGAATADLLFDPRPGTRARPQMLVSAGQQSSGGPDGVQDRPFV